MNKEKRRGPWQVKPFLWLVLGILIGLEMSEDFLESVCLNTFEFKK